jgi:hypothetical protein
VQARDSGGQCLGLDISEHDFHARFRKGAPKRKADTTGSACYKCRLAGKLPHVPPAPRSMQPRPSCHDRVSGNQRDRRSSSQWSHMFGRRLKMDTRTRLNLFLRLRAGGTSEQAGAIVEGICRWRHGYNDSRSLTAMVNRRPMRRFRFFVKTRAEPISCHSHAAVSTANGATANPEVWLKQWSLGGGGPEEHDPEHHAP